MLNFFNISLNSNIKKFYIIELLDSLWFLFPVIIIFFFKSGLDLGQVGIIMSIWFFSQVIMEIPSSIWADKYSRKKVLILSSIFSLIATLVFFMGNSFEYFILAAIFMGFSNALGSGTNSAIVYDTLLKVNGQMKRHLFLLTLD